MENSYIKDYISRFGRHRILNQIESKLEDFANYNFDKYSLDTYLESQGKNPARAADKPKHKLTHDEKLDKKAQREEYLNEIRKTFPRQGMPWDKEDNDELVRLYKQFGSMNTKFLKCATDTLERNECAIKHQLKLFKYLES